MLECVYTKRRSIEWKGERRSIVVVVNYCVVCRHTQYELHSHRHTRPPRPHRGDRLLHPHKWTTHPQTHKVIEFAKYPRTRDFVQPHNASLRPTNDQQHGSNISHLPPLQQYGVFFLFSATMGKSSWSSRIISYSRGYWE